MHIDIKNLRDVEVEKEIPFEELALIIEDAVVRAYIKHITPIPNDVDYKPTAVKLEDEKGRVRARVGLDRKTGDITIFAPVYNDEDERTGVKIVLRAVEEPLRQIAENSGLEGSVVVADVAKAKAGFGLNAATGEIVDLVAAGVIDPAMVTRSALQNAASIAKNILITEAIIAEMPDESAGGHGHGGGMPDMGGMM